MSSGKKSFRIKIKQCKKMKFYFYKPSLSIPKSPREQLILRDIETSMHKQERNLKKNKEMH